ncbi:hypothetical protein [Streptomyces violascens]|uniref:hypothetical protein n=1 Tax=Streptomyces violascens TaxID=67381 RepID=UPI00365EEE73
MRRDETGRGRSLETGTHGIPRLPAGIGLRRPGRPRQGRDCPGGDREANVLTDYDPHLEGPNVDEEAKKKADRVAQAFTTWRDENFHDEGWVRIINGAVETVTTRAW